jgi:hypothetical protein
LDLALSTRRIGLAWSAGCAVTIDQAEELLEIDVIERHRVHVLRSQTRIACLG